jgi:hypothetical protein
MRDELLNGTLFFTVRQARSILARAELMITIPSGRTPRSVTPHQQRSPPNSKSDLRA